MIKWCSTDVGELTAQAEQKYYLPCFHMCPDCHAQVLEHCWRAFGETLCAFMESPALIPLPSSLFLCFPNHRGSVALSLIPVFWGCPPQSCDKIPSVKGCWQSRAVSTLGRNLVQWEQRSSLKQLMLRCPCLVICGAGFTLKHVSSLPADAACWAWGPELLVKPANVWLKAPVRGIHMATTSAAPGAVSKCPLSSAVEFEMGACLSLGPAGNVWRLEQCWLWHLSQSKVVSESNITDWWICLS